MTQAKTTHDSGFSILARERAERLPANTTTVFINAAVNRVKKFPLVGLDFVVLADAQALGNW
jgi:hypothetical protein